MKTQLQPITQEISEKIFAYVSTLETQSFIKTMKDGTSDSGTFEVVISTADQDRQGEIVDQLGWDLNHYKNNPIVLWGHNYSGLPIGVTDSIEMVDGKLVAKGRFAPEDANPFAQQVRKLYDAKILRTTSVGFIAREMDGNRVTKAELLEFSFVPVPANPMALSLMKTFVGEEIITKCFCEEKEAEKAEPKEGDPCTTDDGKDGVYAPNSDGTLVCQLKPEPTDPEAEKSEKSGRTLSEKSKTKIMQAIDGIKSSLVALEELLDVVDLGGDAPLEADTRSNEVSEEDKKSFKEWNKERQLLRIINNVTSDALHKFNEKHDSSS